MSELASPTALRMRILCYRPSPALAQVQRAFAQGVQHKLVCRRDAHVALRMEVAS